MKPCIFTFVFIVKLEKLELKLDKKEHNEYTKSVDKRSIITRKTAHNGSRLRCRVIIFLRQQKTRENGHGSRGICIFIKIQ